MTTKSKGILYLALISVIWGASFLLINYTLTPDPSPLQGEGIGGEE